jgi:hypothetical protein
MCASSLRNWSMLIREPTVLEHWVNELEVQSVRPLKIIWRDATQRDAEERPSRGASGPANKLHDIETLARWMDCNNMVSKPHGGL